MSLMQFWLTMRRMLPAPKDASYNPPPLHSEVFATWDTRTVIVDREVTSTPQSHDSRKGVAQSARRVTYCPPESDTAARPPPGTPSIAGARAALALWGGMGALASARRVR
jgi:hypothetical protein